MGPHKKSIRTHEFKSGTATDERAVKRQAQPSQKHWRREATPLDSNLMPEIRTVTTKTSKRSTNRVTNSWMMAQRLKPSPLPAADAAGYADRSSKPKKGQPTFIAHGLASVGGWVNWPSYSARTARARAAVPASSQRRATRNRKKENSFDDCTTRSKTKGD